MRLIRSGSRDLQCCFKLNTWYTNWCWFVIVMHVVCTEWSDALCCKFKANCEWRRPAEAEEIHWRFWSRRLRRSERVKFLVSVNNVLFCVKYFSCFIMMSGKFEHMQKYLWQNAVLHCDIDCRLLW